MENTLEILMALLAVAFAIMGYMIKNLQNENKKAWKWIFETLDKLEDVDTEGKELSKRVDCWWGDGDTIMDMIDERIEETTISQAEYYEAMADLQEGGDETGRRICEIETGLELLKESCVKIVEGQRELKRAWDDGWEAWESDMKKMKLDEEMDCDDYPEQMSD